MVFKGFRLFIDICNIRRSFRIVWFKFVVLGVGRCGNLKVVLLILYDLNKSRL